MNGHKFVSSNAVRRFSEAGIGISYLYSFLLGGKGILVFRTDNNDLARNVILTHQMNYIDEQALTAI